jgi:hypothetical protein
MAPWASLIATLLSPGALSLAAQTTSAPVPASTPSQSLPQEEVLELSPFTVESTRDSGYMASSTMAGTRIRTDLADIGSAISVLTKEFMQDVGGLDNETVLAYALNTDVGGARGNFMGPYASGPNTNEDALFANPNGNNRIRGLDSADNTRNFFLSEIPWDGYNTDRVDIQRGPNAMLFGVGRPAGVINASTYEARFQGTEGEVSVRTDKFGSLGLRGDFNVEVIDNQLALRIAFLNDREKFRREPAFEDDDRRYFAAKYMPSFLNSSERGIRFEIGGNYEHGAIESNRPRFLTPGDTVKPFFQPFNQGGSGRQIVDYRIAGAGTNAVGGRTINTGRYVAPGEPGPMLTFNGLPLAGGGELDYWLPANARNQSPFNFNGQVAAQNVFNGALQTLSNLTRQQVAAQGNAANGTTPDMILWNGLGRILNDRFTNPNVFDFYNNMFEGDSKREFRDWDAFDLNVTNTFFHDRLGYNVAYHNEDMHFNRYAFLGDNNNLIRVDPLATLTDMDVNASGQVLATPNPNVGRAFIQHQLSNGTSQSDINRESVRAQVFGSYDFRQLNKDSFWTKLLGKHNFTGLYEGQNVKEVTRNLFLPAAFGPEYMAKVFPNNTAFDNNAARLVVRSYVSDDLRGVGSYDDARIGRVQGNIYEMLTGQGNLRYFDETWKLATGPTAGSGAWTTPDGNTIGSGGQRQNPANYVGWTNVSMPIYSLLDPDRVVEGASIPGITARDYLTRDARGIEDEVESKVFVWQAYFWNDSIVGTYGYREDDVWRYRVDSGARPAGGPYNRPAEGADMRPENFGFGRTVAPPGNGSDLTITDPEAVTTRNWSVTLHLNKLMGERDFLPLRVSLYYNEGENVDPFSNTALDIYGNTQPLARGETRDISLLLATKDNKYSLRVTDYESQVINRPSAALQNAFNIQQVLDAGAKREFEYGQWEASGGASGFNPAQVPDPTRFNSIIRPAWRQFAQDMETMFPYLMDQMFTNGTITNATEATTVANFPANATIEDTLSKGLEFEFVANPTPNWRIAINAAKTEAIRDNAPGESFETLMNFMDHAFTDTPVGEMTFNQNTGTTINTSTLFGERWSGYRGQYLRLLALNGQAQPEIRKWRFNLVTNYSFTEGKLKGLGLGGAFRYEDPLIVSYPILPIDGNGDGTTDTYAAYDVSKPFWGPKEETVDLWASYQMKITKQVRWRIQLNVYNVLGENELIPLNMEPDGRAVEFRIKEGISWALTNTFSF